ncbi:MAG: hypothetical protein CL424_09980 [Acidimicrobiaceae bacterium]|nr:hypothetical protein [Acidimicrobiaceae bacterium]
MRSMPSSPTPSPRAGSDRRPESQPEFLGRPVESDLPRASCLMSAVVAGVETRRPDMKYFVLLAGYGEMRTWDELTPEEQEAGIARHVAFGEACAARDGVEIVSAEALGDGSSATTLRTRGGQMTVTDGPFAEAAEHIGGYYLLDAPDLDTVIELCRILPAYDIDIRPVIDTP